MFEGKVECRRVEDGEVVGWRPEDYIGAETPEWALWGKGGFDPRDERHWRKGKGPKAGKEKEKVGDGEVSGGAKREDVVVVEI